MSQPPLVRFSLRQWEVVAGTLPVAVLVLGGVVDPGGAWAAVRQVLPVLAFLVAILVLARRCADGGLFEAIGARAAGAGRSSAIRSAGLGFATAAVVTAVLNLDATVVLLGPVLVAVAVRSGHSPRPAAWASVRLANSASTLLPVSNLTNLLAFSASGLSFLGFAWRMWPVWVVAVGAEWAVLRLWFRSDLQGTGEPEPREIGEPEPPDVPPPVPRLPLVVVAAMLAGFVLGSPLGVDPAWPAAIGAVVLVVDALRRGRTTAAAVASSAGLPLAYLVACWSVVVAAAGDSPIGDWFESLLPARVDLLGVLTLALLSMILANLVNNLPAILLLVPLTAPLGNIAVLAVLVGVNVGANLTYTGSLANVLWTRALPHGRPRAVEFHLLGLATTPVIVVTCAATLWAWTCALGRV